MKRVRVIPQLAPRARDAHKGCFGRVLVLGGSRGMPGAPALAANAALRAGAGLVTLAIPKSIQVATATLAPCATSIPLPEDAAGLLNPRGSLSVFRRQNLLSRTAGPTVVAAGPGLGRGGSAFDRGWFDLLDCLAECGIPIVLDADGLNALHRKTDWDGPGWDAWHRFRGVLTPHPGELARLLGISTADVQQHRERLAVTVARQMNRPRATRLSRKDGPPAAAPEVVVVLKGADTIVTDGQRVFVNRTGNPGMATGGSGDILTGVIAALIAQGLSFFDAAVAGTHVHGLAGDLAARELGEVSLIASDLLSFLPTAFLKQRPQPSTTAGTLRKRPRILEGRDRRQTRER